LPEYHDSGTKRFQHLGIRHPTATVTLTGGVVGTIPKNAGRYPLQRMFPTFPSGWPGVGLLLLRLALALTVGAYGLAYVADWRHLGYATWAIGLLAVASGLSLLVGYLTPFAGVLAGLTTVSSAFPWFPAPNSNLFATGLATALATVIAVAIVCLGPGAFSLDARLFGRREIVIPSGSPSSKP
jgi:uncharacterized membrane protein YphA (DoxX/SURF4 family)